MAIGDRTQKRRKQITDRIVIALTVNDNAWTTTRELTGMLLDNTSNSEAERRRKPRHVTMRYLPTPLQLAQFMRIDGRFEQRRTGKQNQYRLFEVEQ